MECKVKQHLEEVSNTRYNDVLKELQLEHNILESEIQTQYQQLQDKHILLTSKVAKLTSALKEANISLAIRTGFGNLYELPYKCSSMASST
jgi:hypothetical protein